MKTLAGTILLVAILGLFAMTNPKMDSYVQFVRSEAARAQAARGQQDDGFLAALFGLYAKLYFNSTIDSAIIESTVRKDYVFFSLYDSKGSGAAGQHARFLGILNNFFPLEPSPSPAEDERGDPDQQGPAPVATTPASASTPSAPAASPAPTVAPHAEAAAAPLVPEGEQIPDAQKVFPSGGTSDRIAAIAFGADGAKVASFASGRRGGVLELSDLASGRPLQVALTEPSRIAALSRGGALLAVAVDTSRTDHSVSLWDLASGRRQGQLTGIKDYIKSLALSAEGTRLAVGIGNGTTEIWDVSNASAPRHIAGHRLPGDVLAFNHSGTVLAMGGGHSVRLVDSNNGHEMNSITIDTPSDRRGVLGGVIAIAFSPDGSSLAIALDTSGGLYCQRAGRDSSTYAAVRIWNLADASEQRRLTGFCGESGSLAFSPDGATLAIDGGDRVRFWDSKTGFEKDGPTGHRNTFDPLAVSSDGRTLAAGAADGAIWLWDLANGTPKQRLLGLPGRATALAFSADGAMLASDAGNDKIRLWDLASGQQRQALNSPNNQYATEMLAFARNDEVLLANRHWYVPELWDLRSGERKEIHGVSNRIALSPDGNTVAFVNEKNQIALRDLSASRQTRTLTPSGKAADLGESIYGAHGDVPDLGFNDRGDLLASGHVYRGALRIWDVAKGREQQVLNTADKDELLQIPDRVAFDPNGTSIAAIVRQVGSSRQWLRIWDLATGRLRQTLDDVQGDLAFSRDGTLITGGDRIHLWTRAPDTGDYRLSRILFAGRRGLWISCDVQTDRCLRYDDGTLARQPGTDGRLAPVPPPAPASPADLRLGATPAPLVAADGAVTALTLKVRNQGQGPAYWVTVTAEDGVPGHPALRFDPPPTLARLEPGAEAELACGLATPLPLDDPRGGPTELRLRVGGAHGEPLRVVIPVTVAAPALDWGRARLEQEGERRVLVVALTNSGGQALARGEFEARLAGEASPLRRVRWDRIAPGETIELRFGVPRRVALGDEPRVSLAATADGPPPHRWQFSERPVGRSLPVWMLYGAAVLMVLLGSGVVLYRRGVARRPPAV